MQTGEADAECTARWVAWSRWRGGAPANELDELDEADYALKLILTDEPPCQ